MNNFSSWWNSLWTDATVVGGAIAGFISSAVMFILGDMIWKTRVEKIKSKKSYQVSQLNNVYAPLYRFYREAYVRFDRWKEQNPDSALSRQPFFEPGHDEIFVKDILSEHTGYASQKLIQQWTDYVSTEENSLKKSYRLSLVTVIVKEYHGLLKKLKLDYDKTELKTGLINQNK